MSRHVMSCHVMSLFIQCDTGACGSCVTSFVPLYNLKVMKSGKGPVTIQKNQEEFILIEVSGVKSGFSPAERGCGLGTSLALVLLL